MDPKSTIDAILESEQPIQLNHPPLMEGDFGAMMRKIEKERKQAERDANVRTNNWFCRKRCKLFKKCQCFNKSYEDQCKCEKEKTYLKLQAELDAKQA